MPSEASLALYLCLMEQLLQAALAPANVCYTILLGFILLYWVTVFIGALDLDFLDIDVDTDVDADVDLDADVDGEMDSAAGAGWWMETLAFFNLGKVPFMVFLSFLVLFMWGGSLLAYDIWGQSLSWFALIIFVPNLLLGLFATKLVTQPMGYLFKRIKHQNLSQRQLVGKIATLTMSAPPHKLSQAELTFDDNYFLFNVESEDDELLPRGTKVLLVEYREAQDRFLVTAFSV